MHSIKSGTCWSSNQGLKEKENPSFRANPSWPSADITINISVVFPWDICIQYNINQDRKSSFNLSLFLCVLVGPRTTSLSPDTPLLLPPKRWPHFRASEQPQELRLEPESYTNSQIQADVTLEFTSTTPCGTSKRSAGGSSAAVQHMLGDVPIDILSVGHCADVERDTVIRLVLRTSPTNSASYKRLELLNIIRKTGGWNWERFVTETAYQTVIIT